MGLNRIRKKKKKIRSKNTCFLKPVIIACCKCSGLVAYAAATSKTILIDIGKVIHNPGDSLYTCKHTLSSELVI